MSGKPLTKATSDLVRVVGIDDNHHENIEITNINDYGSDIYAYDFILFIGIYTNSLIQAIRQQVIRRVVITYVL